MNTIILIISTLFSGLVAGLFYSWTISVTPGIGKIGDSNYLQAFQSMNRAILNPVFFIPFFGLVILLPLLLYFFHVSEELTQYWYSFFAAIIYLVGIIGVTILGNVPLNNSLEDLQIHSMSIEQMTSFRDGFENRWNQLNMIRTICSSITFLLLVLACIKNSSM